MQWPSMACKSFHILMSMFELISWYLHNLYNFVFSQDNHYSKKDVVMVSHDHFWWPSLPCLHTFWHTIYVKTLQPQLKSQRRFSNTRFIQKEHSHAEVMWQLNQHSGELPNHTEILYSKNPPIYILSLVTIYLWLISISGWFDKSPGRALQNVPRGSLSLPQGRLKRSNHLS